MDPPSSLELTFEPPGPWRHSLVVTKPVVPTRVRFDTLRKVLSAPPLGLSSNVALLVESVIFRAWPRLTSGTYLDAVSTLERIAGERPDWADLHDTERARHLVCSLACVALPWAPVDAARHACTPSRGHVRECTLLAELETPPSGGGGGGAGARCGADDVAPSRDTAMEWLRVTRADVFPGFRSSHDPPTRMVLPSAPDAAEFAGTELGGADPCPRCGNVVNNGATANQERAGDENFETDYVCARCGNEWRIKS